LTLLGKERIVVSARQAGTTKGRTKMATAKKTVKLSDLLELANSMLVAEGVTEEGCMALCVLVESVLLEAHAYNGYRETQRNDENGKPIWPSPYKGRQYLGWFLKVGLGRNS
jgi:hypothetical protein